MREEMGGGWGPRFREESGSVGAAVRTWDAESWPRACQRDRGRGKDREQRGGRSTGPSSAGRQQLGGLGKCADFASPAPFPSDRA